MDEVIVKESLRHRCEKVLSSKGRLSTAIPGFVAREPQIALAQAIAEAISKQSTLVAEAGTGTGKTFAYLIPCLLSGQKALISTATKTLQDQLFNKDLPILIRALGLSSRVQNLKGRANYICRYRTQLHTEEGQFNTQQCANDILFVHEKMSQLVYGERHELPEIVEDSAAWPYVTSTTENCLGNECAFYQECFLVKARKKALDADIVVINHHLFFADSRLKDEGFGELLPGVDVVIFDEAHQLAEIAINFHGQRVSTRQLRDLMDDTLREWPVLDLVNQPLKQLSFELDRFIEQLTSTLKTKEERISWEDVNRNKAFTLAWENLISFTREFLACFNNGVDLQEETGLNRCKMRLEALLLLIQQFNEQKPDVMRWMERFKHSLAFNVTPFNIAASFKSLMKRKPSAYIFTSATLTMATSFDAFMKPLGLENVKTLLLASPFNYKTQALLYLPRDLPDPKEHHYYEALLAKALPIINQCGGRCFFLFTSHRALNYVAELMLNRLPFPLLIQGDESKPILLSRFRELGNAVLLGTATFWEGVDVKGEALSCVIIDKLPFASPSDPIIRGRMAYLKAQGLSSFDALTLPNAVLTLKQGVGRLIRDEQDYGILMIADPRLTGRNYGRHILASLPSMRKTRDENTALEFLRSLYQ